MAYMKSMTQLERNVGRGLNDVRKLLADVGEGTAEVWAAMEALQVQLHSDVQEVLHDVEAIFANDGAPF